MITRTVMVKSVLFVVLTLALIIYIGAHFLGVFNFIGARPYTVTMAVPDAAGLFPRSEVTYRGIKVGTLGQFELTDRGVDVPLIIDSSDTRIPADLKAVVADRSAVGERFVNLLPNRDQGPYLHDGSRIESSQVTSPIPVENVLGSLDSLAASVPLDDLRTSVRELGTAFDGLGPKLQLLLDSTNSLTDSAQQHLPQTLKLIHDGHTVLDTQNDLSDPIKSFSKNLKLVAEQLKKSDPDVRRLLRTGPDAGEEISDLLDESEDGLHDTIREGLTLSQILKGRLTDIRAILQLYPGLAAAYPSLLPPDGTAHLGVVLNINDPPLCTKGYENTVIRTGTDLSPVPINFRGGCKEPVFSPIDVRGVKAGYPFVNGRPTPPPDWYKAFYTDGPQAGIFGPSRAKHGRKDYNLEGKTGGPANANTYDVVSPAAAPVPLGLLGAPASSGDFGLDPGTPDG